MNPSRIRILAVAKLRKSWVLEGASTFSNACRDCRSWSFAMPG